LESRGVAQLG